MRMPSTQMLRVVGVTLALGALCGAVVSGWADETQAALSESERAARIQQLQRDRAKVEHELHTLRSQPEGLARSTVPRSELSDQPTRNIKESLESVPGVSARRDSGGRDVQFSIRGSK